MEYSCHINFIFTGHKSNLCKYPTKFNVGFNFYHYNFFERFVYLKKKKRIFRVCKDVYVKQDLT